MDHMLRSVNCSVQKSVDINGSDLPLSGTYKHFFFIHTKLENYIYEYFFSFRSVNFEILLQFRIRGTTVNASTIIHYFINN